MSIIAQHWNRVVSDNTPKRELKVRSYAYASELGKPVVDRWLSMRGVAPTNDFTNRTLRVFDTGKIIEYAVMRALSLAGVLNRNQSELELPATGFTIPVRGRLDATIGGFVDWDDAMRRAEDNINAFRLGDDDGYLQDRAATIIEGLRAAFPKGMPDEIVLEVKSINSMAFHNSRGNRDENGFFVGYPHHKLQLYAYLLMTRLQQGIVLYVSKDDMVTEEVSVHQSDTAVANMFWDDLYVISTASLSNERPELEPEIVYNSGKGKFEVNWAVGRSRYLTYLYGYSNEDAFEQHHHQTILDLNRALKHLREGKVKPEDTALIEAWNMGSLV